MSNSPPLNLYEQLPALYRIRDEEIGAAAQGLPLGDPKIRGPLRELLELVESQVELLRENIGELYDDFFIETCADWVIPYIGDLIGNKPIYDISRTRRADVARTIYYRQRKGTHTVIEELSNDVTGWPSFVVPFFELLSWTQNLNHLRLGKPVADADAPRFYERVGTVPVRNLEVLDRLGGPFGGVTHSVDVRRMSNASGWYGPRKIGIFHWRIKSFLMESVPARRTADLLSHQYFFSPLGNPLRLHRNPLPTSPEALSTEENFPDPIRRVSFQSSPAPYVESRSLRIRHGGADVAPETLLCMDLSAWAEPPVDRVGVDVVTGRLNFGSNVVPANAATVRVDYNYGFPGEIGGGPYARLIPVYSGEKIRDTAEYGAWNPVLARMKVGAGETFASVAAAIAQWVADQRPAVAIEITDNATYNGDLDIDLGGASLIIRSRDGKRPVIAGNIAIADTASTASLVLSGLLLAGGIGIEGDLGRLTLSHCTLVPGRTLAENGEPVEPHAASIRATASAVSLSINIERSIVGRIEAPSTIVGLRIADSIVDSATRAERAIPVSVLLSGNLAPFPALSAPANLRVSAGSNEARVIALNPLPGTLAEARDRLQDAIRNSAPANPSFENVAVVTVGSRLAVTSTLGEPVWIEPEPGSAAAGELRLVQPDARRMSGLLGGTVDSFAGFSDPNPAVVVEMGAEPPQEAEITGAPATPASLRDQLQNAVRNAGATQAYTAALVGLVEQRLLVIPGEENTPITFAPAAAPAALFEAALESARPAIAGSPGGNPAPASSLYNVTVLGSSFFREIAVANQCIFTRPVHAEKRQSGCIRFSYVPPGSATPRRYRCQPDRAAQGLSGAARDLVLAQIIPEFTSLHYGDAAYCQLALACCSEIAKGAEDGGEMGAWHLLLNPMRAANLRIRLEEYLPFGLEAASIFVS